MPSLAGADGRKFSTSTSAVSTKRWRMARPRVAQIERDYPLAAIGAEKEPAFTRKPRRELEQHVACGDSILTTEAPRSASDVQP